MALANPFMKALWPALSVEERLEVGMYCNVKILEMTMLYIMQQELNGWRQTITVSPHMDGKGEREREGA